jgi:ABC-type amino acid transport system permease subunit
MSYLYIIGDIRKCIYILMRFSKSVIAQKFVDFVIHIFRYTPDFIGKYNAVLLLITTWVKLFQTQKYCTILYLFI